MCACSPVVTLLSSCRLGRGGAKAAIGAAPIAAAHMYLFASCWCEAHDVGPTTQLYMYRLTSLNVWQFFFCTSCFQVFIVHKAAVVDLSGWAVGNHQRLLYATGKQRSRRAASTFRTEAEPMQLLQCPGASCTVCVCAAGILFVSCMPCHPWADTHVFELASMSCAAVCCL